MTAPLVAIPTYHLGPGQVRNWEGAYALPESYVAALRAAGARVALLPRRPARGDPEELLAPFDGLLLAGGGDIEPARYGADDHWAQYGIDPDRDQLELELARAAVRLELPTLGICRGVQLLNVAFGGTLVQHLEDGDAKVVHRDEAMQAMHGLRGRAGQPPGRGPGAGRGRVPLPPPPGPRPARGGVPAGRLGAGRAGRGDRARRGLDRWRALAPREHGRRRPGPAPAAGDLRGRGVPAWTGVLARERRAGRVWPARERRRVNRVGRSVRPSR